MRTGDQRHPIPRGGQRESPADGLARVNERLHLAQPGGAGQRRQRLRGMRGSARASGARESLGRHLRAHDRRQARSELFRMMGLVATVVAMVILVFFALGYAFGRLFL